MATRSVNGRLFIAVFLGSMLVVSAATAGGYWYATRLPKRFAEVVPGRLYRSGEVTERQLQRLRDEYRVRRVLCLYNSESPEAAAERAAAERLGLKWLNVSLPGDGASTPADRARILELLRDTNDGPTLVHCAAGANRTGLAIGLYRIYEQGWDYDRVVAEMVAYDFENKDKHENLRAALREAVTQRDATLRSGAALPGGP